MRISAIAAIAVLGIALSGCATVFEGSSQKIAIASTPSGAHCVLSNGEGKWSVTTPAHVNVERSKKDMKVKCTKEGYKPVKATIPSDLETWTLANFLILDLPGLGVDAATGAINAYPDSSTIHLKRSGGAQSDTYSYDAAPVAPAAPSRSDQAPAYFDSDPSNPDASADPDASQPDSTQDAPGSLPPDY